MTEIGEILAKDFKEMGYSVATRECPWWVAKVGAVFMSELASTMKGWGIKTEFVNTESKEVLGIGYTTPMEQTIKDMVLSMMATGVLEDKRKK